MTGYERLQIFEINPKITMKRLFKKTKNNNITLVVTLKDQTIKITKQKPEKYF